MGNEAEFARDIGLAAAPDCVIAERALATGAALLTRDLDFVDIRSYPPERYPGIVILRVPDDAIALDIVRIAGLFLRVPAFVTQLSRRLAIVEPDRVRFRPPLP